MIIWHRLPHAEDVRKSSNKPYKFDLENLFKSILGEQLSSVVFVQNYLQLDFDGNRLTSYSWPKVKIKNTVYVIGREYYRDALCEIITHLVSDVILIDDEALHIYFDNSFELSWKLLRDNENYDLPEFIYFTDCDGGWFVLD